MFLADQLTTLDPPFTHLAVLPPGVAALSLPAMPPEVVIRTIDGRRAPTKGRLLAELSRRLEFPSHFGANWDALEDCLTDLAWLTGTGYVLVLTRAEQILHRQPREFATLVDVLDSVGRTWATGETGHPGRRPTPFHTLLVVAQHHLAARRDWRLPRLSP